MTEIVHATSPGQRCFQLLTPPDGARASRQSGHPRLPLARSAEGRELPRYTLHQLRHTVGSALFRELPEHLVRRNPWSL